MSCTEPDWNDLGCRTALNTVLKWEIQNLLQRLAETGEEALVLTASLDDGGTSTLGSKRGQGFLMLSDLHSVKSQFLSYCKACCNSEETEAYRDLVSGQITIGPKQFHSTAHKRKRSSSSWRKKAAKLSHKDDVPDSYQNTLLTGLLRETVACRNKQARDSSTSPKPKVKIEVDDVGEIAVLNIDQRLEDELVVDNHSGQSYHKTGNSSRRKRTPKKITRHKSDSNSGDDVKGFKPLIDTAPVKTGLQNQSENETVSGNQSDEFELTGSHSYSVFNLNETQSKDKANLFEDQSSLSESSSDHFNTKFHTDQLTKAFIKKGIHNIYSSMNIKDSALYGSMHTKNTSDDTAISLSANCSQALSKCDRMQKSASVISNNEHSEDFEMDLDESGDSSMTESVGQLAYQTIIGEEGLTTIDYCSRQKDRKKETAYTIPEPLQDSFGQSGRRVAGKGFKAAGSDENPEVTALLDAAKVGVGRYQCPYCSLVVRDRHDLKRHLRTHTKQKPYQCKICSRKFSRKWDHENHMRRHTEESINEKLLEKTPVKMVNLDETQLHKTWVKNMVAKLDLEYQYDVDSQNQFGEADEGTEAVQDVSKNDSSDCQEGTQSVQEMGRSDSSESQDKMQSGVKSETGDFESS